MKYAVIDTNVLVSAMLKRDSIPGKIMELAFEEYLVPLLNTEIMEEYKTVLLRPKFHLTEDIVNDVLNTIEENGIYIDAEKLSIELPDPKDIIFYEVVMNERKKEDAYLITGNKKHFPSNPFV